MSRFRHEPRLRPGYRRFKRLPSPDGWFEVYRITNRLIVFYEPRHYEETLASLLIGRERAALIDTGCGIGDLRGTVKQLTNLPVLVVNTHTHPDHIGANHQFNEIALFDHPRSRRIAGEGVDHEVLRNEILAEGLIHGDWPRGFDPTSHEIPPFEVDRWLADGDPIDLGGPELEVIHTPGEAPDHICLLDRANRVLFCGDILLADGDVWTHLEGGSLEELSASYRRLMQHFDEFDYLMPSHNEPWIDKKLLPEALEGAERVAAGEFEPKPASDPWGRRLNRYSLERMGILTAQPQGVVPPKLSSDPRERPPKK